MTYLNPPLLNTMKNRHYLFNLFLLLLAAATGWMIWASSDNSTDEGSSAGKPDGFMTNVDLTQFDKEGHVTFKLTTPRMTHYPADNSSLMTTPQFTVYSKTDSAKEPWDIVAKHGKTSNGIDTIFLWDDVIMTQPSNGTKLSTIEAYYYPNKRMAQTSEGVLMQQPGLAINAKGLTVYFDTGIAQLLSEVRGQYDPAKTKP
jgi:lipopolysaccharide export system protein LptC